MERRRKKILNLKGKIGPKRAPHDDVAYGQARTFLISLGGASVAITFPTSKLAKTTLCVRPPTTTAYVID